MEEKEVKKTKLSFFKRVLISIKDFDKYQIFAVEKLSKSIKYLFQIVAIFVIIISSLLTYKFFNIIQYSLNYFENEIPNLKYEENILSVDTDKIIKIEQNKDFPANIIIDTITENEEEIQTQIDNLKNYDNAVLILKDKIILKNSMTNLVSTYNYSDIAKQYNITNFTKEEALNFIANNINYTVLIVSYFIVMFIYMFVIYLASIAVDAIMIAVLGFLTARIVGLKLRFTPCYNLAVHALTLSIILNAIYIVANTFIGLTISYFQVVYTVIACIYMVTAILLIKQDLIKQTIEVGIIQEEQEKIKQAIEKQKQEEEKKKEKNPDKKDPDEKNPDEEDLSEKEKQKKKEPKKPKSKEKEPKVEPEGNQA